MKANRANGKPGLPDKKACAQPNLGNYLPFFGGLDKIIVINKNQQDSLFS
jgi:hypothetical protein